MAAGPASPADRSRPEEPWPQQRHNGLLVDREEACERLRAALGGLAEGRSAAVRVLGVPGSGRSALLRWTADLAERSGVQVMYGRGSAQESGLRYGVVQQLLGSAYRRGRSTSDERAARQALNADLCRTFLRAARGRPLLVVVDGLEWADPWSRSLLDALSRRLRQAPVLLVTAAGPGSPQQAASGLTEVGGEIVELRPLSVSGIRTVLERAHGGPVDDAFVEAAARATRGNPKVLCAAVVPLVRGPLTMSPGTLAELTSRAGDAADKQVSELLDTLPWDLVLLLRAIVVCGRELPPALVCGLAGLRTLSAPRAIALLRAAGLLAPGEPLTASDEETASIVLAGMASGAREELYAAAARLGQRAAIDDEKLARLLLSTRRTGRPWAVQALRGAAAAGRNRGDNAASARYLQRALKEDMDKGEQAQLLLELGAAEMAQSPHAGDAPLVRVFMDTTNGVIAPLRLGAIDLLYAKGVESVATRLADQDASAGEPLSPAASWPLELTAAQDQSHDQLLERLLDSSPAAALAGHPVRAALTSWRLMLRGRSADRSQELARLALRQSQGDSSLFATRIMASRVLVVHGRYDEALAGLEAVLAETSQPYMEAVNARALEARAWTLLRCARLKEAELDLNWVRERLPAHRWHTSVSLRFTTLEMVLHVYRSQFGAALRLAEEAGPGAEWDATGWPGLLWARGCARLGDGDAVGAATDLEECGRRLLHKQITHPNFISWRYFAAIARHVCGDTEAATRLAEEHQRLSTAWRKPSAVGTIAVGIALASDRELGEEALVRAARAVSGSDRLPSAPELAQWTAAMLSAGTPAVSVRGEGPFSV
ncbi:AAA family ATPase [Streptomyces graminilatus]|uniref:AAA family ATPase n=1 Tax=Streptomyces graminilatus TaxID=1464070 RepID=UPI0006E2D43C|nr:ATP-binding protein [Streptomyces graminilatus]